MRQHAGAGPRSRSTMSRFRSGWPGDHVYTAVERASLSVADGEFVSIVGPTGCGKSTLLNVAAGLLAPSSGKASIFGHALSGLNRQAGYLFQAEALFPWKTAIDNVAIGLETAGVPSSTARERAQDWLKRVGLGDRSARAIRTCSPAVSASASALRRS